MTRRLTLTPEARPRFSTHKPRYLADVPPLLLAALRKLAAGEAPWPLYLHGPPGTGKTCAGLALCDHVPLSLYLTAAELTGMVQASYGGGPAVRWEQFAPATDPARPHVGCRLVVLDELGIRERVTDTHYEAVQRVIDARETWPLVLISNLPIAALARVYDARIASRAEAGTVVELTGHDRRTA